jgi:trans-2,3-dihydro-3-hydroxyanthranilate isomerase
VAEPTRQLKLEYHVVDVFTSTPLEGNPVAVFVDAHDVSDAMMQKIAQELNLSESTFIGPPTHKCFDLRVRIFTPRCEMKFAGHPTIGTAFVVRDAGIIPNNPTEMVLEEGVGPVRVRFNTGDSPIIWLESPSVLKGRTFDRSACAQVLGLADDDLLPDIPCQILTAGNPNIFVALRDVGVVDRAVIDPTRLAKLLADQEGPVCMFIFAPVAGGAYSRMFAPALGVTEDPATGSAAGPLATFMMEHGLVKHDDGTRFISEQGTKLGRRSLLHVHIKGTYGARGIDVGGQVVPITRATMTISPGA